MTDCLHPPILQSGLGVSELHQLKVTGPSIKTNRMLEPSKRTAINQSAGAAAGERLANQRASGEEGAEPSCKEHCAARVRCGAGTEPETWSKLVGLGARGWEGLRWASPGRGTGGVAGYKCRCHGNAGAQSWDQGLCFWTVFRLEPLGP